MNNIIDTLITDRTKVDVTHAAALYTRIAEIGFFALTDEEREAWFAGMRGEYNATDLNRVGEAILYLAALIGAYGYTVTVSPRTDWTRNDFPAQTDMAAYIADLAALRDAYFTLPTTPPLPERMEKLGYEGANNIERLLADLAQVVEWMIASFHYAGQFYAGERIEHARIRSMRRRTWAELQTQTWAQWRQQTWNQIQYG